MMTRAMKTKIDVNHPIIFLAKDCDGETQL